MYLEDSDNCIINDNTVVMLFDRQWYTIGLVSLDPTQPSGTPLQRAVELMFQEGGAKPKQIVGVIVSFHCFQYFPPAWNIACDP